ncbi:MAG: DUF1844 domain-containing protein [Candidatus Zixiibacteriota bacterium]
MAELNGPAREQALFSALLFSLHAAGMQQLGKIMNPMSGKVERDLEQAQATIDMMETIKKRTAGNLDEYETKLLGRLLAELQMNYVDEVNREQKPGTPDDGSGKTILGSN